MHYLPLIRNLGPGAGVALVLAWLLAVSSTAVRAQVLPAEDEAVRTAQAPAPDAEPEPEPAQTEPDLPGNVEELKVEGRKATAIETEVPDSVTQFDASTIEALGAEDISDLSRVTPNVNIVQPGATQATFFIRGVGLSDFSSNAAGAVTIFQDDVSLNAPAIQTGSLFDVEGVEIVRGPQGSGPFRNASAGAIRVRSRRPTGNYTGQLRSSIGRYAADGGKGANHALIQDYEGALEVPIVEGALSTRFAFRLREADPFMSNGCGGYLTPIEDRLPRPIPNRPFFDRYTLDDADVCGERGRDIWPLRDRITGGGGQSLIQTGLPSRVKDQHNWAARGMLRFQPADSELAFFLNGHGSRLDQDATLGQAIGTFCQTGGCPFGGPVQSGYQEPDIREEILSRCGPGGCPFDTPQLFEFEENLARDRPLDLRPYRGDYNKVGQETRDTWGGFVSSEGTIGDLELLALASYDAYERTTDQDIDFTPDILFEQVGIDEAWQTYEEISVGGELEVEPIAWTVGSYYLHEDLDVEADTTIALNGFFNRVYSQTIDSVGVWGEFEWDFLDDFTLGGGVRYNWEKKNFDFARDAQILGVPLEKSSAIQEETWSTPTGEIMLTYHIDAEKSLYAKYSRGFKAGHFNALASQNVGKPPADEEYNDAWETGLKGSFFQQRLSLLTSFFYYRYENYQVFLFRDTPAAPPVLEIINAKQAENYGVEVEGRIQPLVGWTPQLLSGLALSANFGWLHGEYLDFQNISEQTIGNQTVPVVTDFSGKQLQNAPDYKVSAALEWTLDFGRFGYLIPRYDLAWTDDVFFDTSEGRGSLNPSGDPLKPEFAIGQRAYALHNARLAYRTPTGNVEFAVWMRNIEDEVYKNFAFDASNFQGVVLNFPGDPRTIGMDLIITF